MREPTSVGPYRRGMASFLIVLFLHAIVRLVPRNRQVLMMHCCRFDWVHNSKKHLTAAQAPTMNSVGSTVARACPLTEIVFLVRLPRAPANFTPSTKSTEYVFYLGRVGKTLYTIVHTSPSHRGSRRPSQGQGHHSHNAVLHDI